jgi:hypothetical protein
VNFVRDDLEHDAGRDRGQDRDVNAAKNLRAEGLRMLADLSPATAERAGSHAREVACAAQSVRQVTVVPLRRRPTQNRGSKARKDRGAASAGARRTGRFNRADAPRIRGRR